MKMVRIANGRVIDPANKRDEIADLWIAGGVFAGPSTGETHASEAELIDATGLIVAPGLIDMHVHFREPGQAQKETIATGSRAAAAGGFSSVVCMPNTNPVADNAGTITLIREKAQASADVNVFTTGAITKGLAGEELAPYGSMIGAGIVAITDDGHCVQNH